MMIRDPADIVAELQGTCKPLHTVLNEAERHDQGLLDAIDEALFECECCSWWCEMSEMSEHEEYVCTDCEDDPDDD